MESSKITIYFLLSFMLVILVVIFNIKEDDVKKIEVSNIYEGEIEGYKVRIEETKIVNASMNIVSQLFPLNNKKCPFCGITGYNYNADERWEVIFPCADPLNTNNCYAIINTPEGWRWYNNKKANKHLNNAQIQHALKKLHESLNLCNKKNKIKHAKR